MAVAADLFETMRVLADTMASSDERILRLLGEVTGQMMRHDEEMAELRDGLVALSNRIEALTQAGLHSVKVPQ